jgi:hypothetical protein
MLKLVHDTTASAVGDPETMTIGLDELCRVAAQDMLAVSLLAERRAYLEAHAQELSTPWASAWWSPTGTPGPGR